MPYPMNDASLRAFEPPAKADRILWNRRPEGRDAGSIDEVVIDGVNVHVEQMSDRCWWIAFYDPTDPDRYWMGNFVADSRGRMAFVEQENSGIEWTNDAVHIGRSDGNGERAD